MKYYVIINDEYLTANDKTTPNKKLAYVFTRNEAFMKAKQLNAEVIAE